MNKKWCCRETQTELFYRGYKYCSICGAMKKLSEFGHCSRTRDGLKGQCKVCRNKQHGEYQKKNRKRLSNYLRDYMREYSRKKSRENPKFIMCGNKKLKKRERPFKEKMQFKWTEDDVRILKSRYPKGGIGAVRGRILKSDKAIWNKARHLGIRRRS